MTSTAVTHQPRIVVYNSRKYYMSAVKQRREKAISALGVNIKGIDEKAHSKSYASWLEATKEYSLRKLYKVTGPFAVSEYLPQTLEKIRPSLAMYYQVASDHWSIAKTLSLRVEHVRDFEFYESLGYDFTQITRENFQWIVTRQDMQLLRLILQWTMEEILPNQEKQVKKYIVPDSIVHAKSSTTQECINQYQDSVDFGEEVENGVFYMEL